MLTLKEYRAMKEKSLRVFRRWEILKAGREMLWRKCSERQGCLLLWCVVIPVCCRILIHIPVNAGSAKHRRRCSRNPADQKWPEETDNLCGNWKHTGLGESVKHLYEHGFAPREERGETSKTAVSWVISVDAACASVQSWRWRGLGLAVVQSHTRQPRCTAPLTGAAHGWQNCSHVRGECRDLQAGTSTPGEADRGGYLTHRHQGTFCFQCQPLWTSCSFTLRWLSKWMISLCCKAD